MVAESGADRRRGSRWERGDDGRWRREKRSRVARESLSMKERPTGRPGEQPAARREGLMDATGTLSRPRPLARPTLSTSTTLVAEWAARVVAFRRVMGERRAR